LEELKKENKGVHFMEYEPHGVVA